MKNSIELKNLDHETIAWLEKIAKQRHQNPEEVIRRILKEKIGQEKHEDEIVYHDLDSFMGTWSEEEAEEFLQSVSDTRKVDPEQWH
ncbi:MAG: hypothetical protein ACLFUS_16070 [Candidatus Sumerlaeia bacterium]